MLLLILSLVNGSQPAPAPEPPRVVARSVAAPIFETVSGAWTGQWSDAAARAPIEVEAAFTPAAAETVFGSFTFIDNGVRRTVLRQGVAAADGLRFVWPGGRRLDLRLTASDRLEGDMVTTPEGAAGVTAGSMSLSRRPR